MNVTEEFYKDFFITDFYSEKQYEEYCKHADEWWKIQHPRETDQEFEIRSNYIQRPPLCGLIHIL